MARPLKLSRRIFVALATALGSFALWLLSSTWRVEGDFGAVDALAARGERWVGAMWHNRIACFMRVMRGRRIAVLISSHSDGEIIARVAERFGFGAPRGSSSRGAAAGLRALREAHRAGDVALTPDGPRGPRYSFAPGVIAVAASEGATVLLGACAVDRAWRAPTWDGFVVPKPFARIRFRIETRRLEPAAAEDEAARERARKALGADLRAMTAALEDEVSGAHEALLDLDADSAEAEAARARIHPPQRPREERRALRAGRRRALAARLGGGALAAAALLLGALAVVRGAALGGVEGGGVHAARGDLCVALVAACALASIAGPACGALGALPALAGGLLGALGAALALGARAGLAGSAAAGALYPALLGLAGYALARRAGGGARGALLGALPPLALVGALFAAGPFMSALPDAGLVLAVLLRVSPVTAIAGSLLEIDLLRAPPLYALVPAASETPYTYPSYAHALLAPAALLGLATLLSILRRR